MKLFLASVIIDNRLKRIITGGGMKLHLAGVSIAQTKDLLFNEKNPYRQIQNQEWLYENTKRGWEDICILESYYYIRDNKFFSALYNKGVDILIDSGAFTYMSSGEHINWEEYIERYAEFINSYKIERFFELDIDKIVGLKKVRRLTAKLESLTGKQCIPVWHISRGFDDFKNMVRDYKYAAVGGYVARDVPREKLEKVFPLLIREAHLAGCKLHGLGYSPTDLSKKTFRFDSVDSTSWIAGNRFGKVYKFNPNMGIIETFDKPAGMRIKNLETAWHNFLEWIKYQQYLKTI